MMGLSERLGVKIVKVEERRDDSWFDMSLREIREGSVRFYRASDSLTGDWLFKVCSDRKSARIIVKALKCPPGRRMAQLEGNAMLFQESLEKGVFYDIVSLSYIDEEDRLRRRIIEKIGDLPDTIKDNFRVVLYEEATGKKALGRKVVTLNSSDDRAFILLFIIERAWPISEANFNQIAVAKNILNVIKDLERAELEEIYDATKKRLGLSNEENAYLLRMLEGKGQISTSGSYVKTLR